MYFLKFNNDTNKQNVLIYTHIKKNTKHRFLEAKIKLNKFFQTNLIFSDNGIAFCEAIVNE